MLQNLQLVNGKAHALGKIIGSMIDLFSETFPNLYSVSLDQNITVEKAFLSGIRNLRVIRLLWVGARKD
jgi:hypothetical protein